MTRHQGFDVRIAPEVLDSVEGTRSSAPRQRAGRAFASAMDQLAREGTRAAGSKKLKGLDLWEIRVGDRRVFFRPVPRGNLIAVGAIVTKKSRRLRMDRLKHIEQVVHRWSDEVETNR